MSREQIGAFRNVRYPDILGNQLAGAIQVAKAAFGPGMSDSEVEQHLRGDFIALATRDGKPAGFGVLQIAHLKTVIPKPSFLERLSPEVGGYFAAAAVAPEFQGKGIYKEINRARMDEVVKRDLPYIFTRTQNPRVREGMLDAITEQIKLGRLHGFEERMQVVPDVYGRMLTAEKPKGRYASPLDSLDHEAGDAMGIVYDLIYLNRYQAERSRVDMTRGIMGEDF